MPAIAKQSGISPGAIYRHFDSKAQLLVEVVRYALQTLPTSVQLLEPAELDAADLPQFGASYTTPQYKLIRQLSLEIHAAASRARGNCPDCAWNRYRLEHTRRSKRIWS